MLQPKYSADTCDVSPWHIEGRNIITSFYNITVLWNVTPCLLQNSCRWTLVRSLKMDESMCTDKVSQYTKFVSKILSTNFTRCLFQPTEGLILMWATQRDDLPKDCSCQSKLWHHSILKLKNEVFQANSNSYFYKQHVARNLIPNYVRVEYKILPLRLIKDEDFIKY